MRQDHTEDHPPTPPEADRRATAIHEAGHAAWRYMTGRDLDVYEVSIVPGNGRLGIVKSMADFGYELHQTPQTATAEIMDSLMGPVAENRHTGKYATLDSLLVDMDSGNRSDLAAARGVAAEMHGEGTGRAHRFLLTRARWTNELVQMDKVWNAINALADALVKTPRLDGEQIEDIFCAAWPSEWFMVGGELGYTWRKRLGIREIPPNKGRKPVTETDGAA